VKWPFTRKKKKLSPHPLFHCSLPLASNPTFSAKDPLSSEKLCWLTKTLHTTAGGSSSPYCALFTVVAFVNIIVISAYCNLVFFFFAFFMASITMAIKSYLNDRSGVVAH